MKAIIVHDLAQAAELDESVAFYESEERGLGLNLLLEVERATKVIEETSANWVAVQIHSSSQIRTRAISSPDFLPGVRRSNLDRCDRT